MVSDGQFEKVRMGLIINWTGDLGRRKSAVSSPKGFF